MEKEQKNRLVARVRPHIWFVLALLALHLIVFRNFLVLDQSIIHDITTAYLPKLEVLTTSISEHGKFFPLWNPFYFSGTPYFARPYLLIDYPFPAWLALFLPGITALKLSYLLDVFLGGVFMYILVHYLTRNRWASFIGGIVYMFNGFILKIFAWGWLTSINAYALSPLIILFILKTFRSKEWVKYAVITGILFAVQIRAGPDLKVTLWVGLMFGLYMVFYLLGGKFKPRLVKSVMVGLLVGAIILGLSAQRVLPTKEFLDRSSRGELPWERASGRQLEWNQIHRVIEVSSNMIDNGKSDQIGIVAFALVAFGIWRKWRNRTVLFFLASSLLAIFLASNFLNMYYFLWKYVPPFGSTRYLDRTLSLYALSASVLVGLGASYLYNYLKNKGWSKKKLLAVFIGIAALIFVDLGVVGNHLTFEREQNIEVVRKNNHVLQYIKQDPGIFRIQTFETRGIDWGTDFWNVPLGLEHIYAYDTQWYPPYFNVYLAFANRNPARLWGILNTKYVTSTQEIDVPGLTFVEKFPDCVECFPETEPIQKAWGPYLYRNEEFLPRAYVVQDAILVLGQDGGELVNPLKQTVYSLMLQPEYNPKNAVIIMNSGRMQDYDLGYLNSFKGIVLTPGAVDQGSGFVLQQYVDQGGILFPDVLRGEQALDAARLSDFFNSLNQSYMPIPDENIVTHDFDHKDIILNQETSGFLVVSEKFAEFGGWNALLDGAEVDIEKANVMISAVRLNGQTGVVNFVYSPKSYKIGLFVTLFTAVFILAYFVNRRMKWVKL